VVAMLDAMLAVPIFLMIALLLMAGAAFVFIVIPVAMVKVGGRPRRFIARAGVVMLLLVVGVMWLGMWGTVHRVSSSASTTTVRSTQRVPPVAYAQTVDIVQQSETPPPARAAVLLQATEPITVLTNHDLSWSSIDSLLPADTYPSDDIAFAAAVEWLDGALLELDVHGDRNLRLEISVPETAWTAKTAESAEAAILKAIERLTRNPLINVYRGDPPQPVGHSDQRLESDYVATLRFTLSDATEGRALQVELQSPDVQGRFTTTIMDRPWAADPQQAAAGGHGDTTHIVGFSEGLTGSRDAAIAEARDKVRDLWKQHAEQIVLNLPDPAVSHAGPSGRSRPTGSARHTFITQRIERLLDPSREEIYVQTFDRPYGQAFRAAIHQSVDARTVDKEIAAAEGDLIRQQVQSQRTTVIRGVTWVSIVGLVAVIGATYAMINALTRGYYTGRLRTLAIIGAVVLIAAGLLVVS